MAIAWTPDLSVGLDQIDDQHKELFKKLDQLLEACNQGKGRVIIEELLRFLGDYVVTHFGTEEVYMDRFAYPETADHKRQHAAFIKQFVELKETFEKEGPGIHIVILTNRTVVAWLNTHIRNTDTKLGAFLKGKL